MSPATSTVNHWPLAVIFEHFPRALGEECMLCHQPGSEIVLRGGECVHIECHQRKGQDAIQGGIIDVMKNCTQPKARKRRAAMAAAS